MRAAGVLTLLILALAATPAAAAPYSSVTPIGKTGNGILRFPQAVAYDNSGVADPGAGAPAGPYVYVADQYSFLVQKFTRSGTFVRQWGGFGTAAGRFGNASGDTVGGIGGLAVDGQGRVFVLDSYNDRVQQFTPGGTFVRSFGSTGTAPGQFQLGINGGIAIHGSSLFVADQNNHRVQRFALDSSGAPTGTPLAFGSFGTGDGQLDHPQGVGVDATAVYVADDRNDRVVKFGHDGTYLGKLGTSGTGGSQFNFAYDAGVDSRGRLYVADNNNHRVQEFEASTFAYHRRWGLLGTEIGRFGYPRSLAGVKGDPAGGVYVGNTSNNRVDQFAPDSTHRGSFGINGRGNGVFMQPKSVAPGTDGSLWVADTFSDRVQKLSRPAADRAGYSRAGTFGPSPAATPASSATPTASRSTRRVAPSMSPTPATIGSSASTARPGPSSPAPPSTHRAASPSTRAAACWWPTPATTASSASSGTTWSTVGSGYARPEAIAPSGSSLYVADTGNSRVLKLDAASGAVQATLAGAGSGAGQVREPEGVAVDTNGNVYVSDTGNDRIARFDAGGAYIDSFGGNGTAAGQVIKPAQMSIGAVRLGGRPIQQPCAALHDVHVEDGHRRIDREHPAGLDLHHNGAGDPDRRLRPTGEAVAERLPEGRDMFAQRDRADAERRRLPDRDAADRHHELDAREQCVGADRRQHDGTDDPARGARGRDGYLSTRPAGFEPATSASGGQRSIH